MASRARAARFIDFADARNAYDARADVDLQAKIEVRLSRTPRGI